MSLPDIYLDSVKITEPILDLVVRQATFPLDDSATILFQNTNGLASSHFPEDTTLSKDLDIKDLAAAYLYRGKAVELYPTIFVDQQTLKFVGAGHWYQFRKISSTYSSIQESLVYDTFEESDPDKENTIDPKYTGMINTLSAGADDTAFEDDNKDWVANEWYDAGSGKFGIIVKKNPDRPVESWTQTQVNPPNGAINITYSGGTDYKVTRTNDDSHIQVEGQSSGARINHGYYLDFVLQTKIPRADVSSMKVKAVFGIGFACSGTYPWHIQIYNYDNDGSPEYQDLQTGTAKGTYYKNYEYNAAGELLEADGATEKFISATGEMKIRINTGSTGALGLPAWMQRVFIYYLRIELEYSDFPTLTFGIDSNTATVMNTDTDLTTDVDVLDYYSIALRCDYILKEIIDLYPWTALTYTNVAAGTNYLGKNWGLGLLSYIIKEAIEADQRDAWIDKDLDVNTKDSGSAAATGLTFSEATPNIQFTGFSGVISAHQLANRIKVQWLSGTVTLNDATSQALYGVWELAPLIRRDITSSAEATLLGQTELSKYKYPRPDLVFKSTLYRNWKGDMGKSVTVDLPKYNISNVSDYIIKDVRYHWSNEVFVDIQITVGKAGSISHRYANQIDQLKTLKRELDITKQIMATITPPIQTSSSSVVPHSETHYPGGDDELLLDEDNMVTDSDEKGASQSSVKAYVDAHAALTNNPHSVDITDIHADHTKQRPIHVLLPQNGYTAGADNVYNYMLLSAGIAFGTNSHAAANYLRGSFIVPADYKTGTDIKLRFYMTAAGAVADIDNRVVTYSHGDAVAQSWEQVDDDTLSPGAIAAADKWYVAYYTLSNADCTFAVGDLVGFAIKMDDNAAAETIFTEGWCFEYTADEYD